MTVIAYRAWNVLPTGELAAVSAKAIWAGGRVTAKCRAAKGRFHLPPNPGCVCGIYAWKRPIDPGFINRWSRRPAEEVAVGVVLLWGRMCDGAEMTGYRAQHARIAALVPDAAGRLDVAHYPGVRVYRDLHTMYGDWDMDPGAGWARDAP